MHGVHSSGQIFGSYFEPFKLKHHVPTTRWWTPQTLSTIPLDYYFCRLCLCCFEIWHHKLKIAEGRGDAPSPSEITVKSFYSQKNRLVKKQNKTTTTTIFQLNKIILIIFFLYISFRWLKIHLSTPVDVMCQRVLSLFSALFCMFYLKLI